MITQYFAAPCSGTGFLGFPTWYAYLPKATVDGLCTPQLTSLNDTWLVVAACLDILLRVAALIAVVFVIYGGAQFIFSQGNPDAANKARGTIINAALGLVLAIMSAVIVQFVAGRFQ